MKRRNALSLLVTLCLILPMQLFAADGAKPTMTTAPSRADLDPTAFAQWVDGKELPLAVNEGPAWVLWTRDSAPGHAGVEYGHSKTPGVRHMRIGFNKPVWAGSVVVVGGGSLSALKPTAAYPGDLSDDKQWIPAQRLIGNRASPLIKTTTNEVGRHNSAIWVLPQKTETRALRFTHTASSTDPSYSGWLGGAFMLAERMTNIAPQAVAGASSKEDGASIINNEVGFGEWDNGQDGAKFVVSPEHPEWVTLVWPRQVTVAGLSALDAGFGSTEAQYFSGPTDRHPGEAQEGDWKTMGVFDGLQNQYPRQLGINWMEFNKPVTSRAIRLKLIKRGDEGHPHKHGATRDGKRVWLGELMALQLLQDAKLDTAIIPAAKTVAEVHPPIPVKFNLKEAGFVTLVIEDQDGKRVRNLISETPFPAGENTVWWDAMDDLGRDAEAARHGIYSIPGQFVPPATYRVRGLTRKNIDVKYEFALYTGGSPAWFTADGTGGWLADHTPPCSALFVPGDKAPGGKPLVFLGSASAEAGQDLVWVDMDGKRVGGRRWIGGVWTGASFLTRDAGPNAAAGQYAYVGSEWEGELRLNALTHQGDKQVVKFNFASRDVAGLNGIAAHNGLMICSLPKLKQLLFVDIKAGRVLGQSTIEDPRGVAFDAQGRLLVLVGNTLRRYTVPAMADNMTLPAPQVLIEKGLDDPRHLTSDAKGNIYISNGGNSHRVNVFTADGTFLRNIGKAGAPKAGPYDPQRMNNPNGISIDERDRLWVAESDFQPKRVSVWTLDGTLIKAFYGPPEYGGGGVLDYKDKTKFYHHGMQFKLDWTKGDCVLETVFYRPGPNDLYRAGTGYPETPVYLNGKRYFTNAYNSNPVAGSGLVTIWIDREGIAVPAAAMGGANGWGELSKPTWPAGVDWRNQAFFAWSDLNDDGQLQVDEVVFSKVGGGSLTVMPDLSILSTRFGGHAVRFAPSRFSAKGAPVYGLETGEVLARDVGHSASSGGDQALNDGKGWTVLTVAAKPYAQLSFSGVNKDGKASWSYPSLWPGLHASHESPVPEFPGELVGTTRLLGGVFTPTKGDAGPMWCVNGNQGNMYLFTTDGLFVSTILRDCRSGNSWVMPAAVRGMLLNDVSSSSECFWPSITQTSDGHVYMICGFSASLVRLDGLDSITRLPNSEIRITDAELKSAQEYLLKREAARQQNQGVAGILKVSKPDVAPAVDGKLDDWKGASWVSIDKRGVAAHFDSSSKPYDVSGAVAISGGRLYVAVRNTEANLLANSGEMPIAPFKTGGALDLMLGTNPKADEKRANPVEGDLRLLVTIVKNKPLALLYRPVVPGTKEPVPFSSPSRTITIDRVDDVSDKLELAGDSGNFEYSIPLHTLGLKVEPGMALKGDIGLLRGQGFQTVHRVYWANKATGITADVPSEAMLTPQLWGKWRFPE
jgi:hypothetical protein